MPGYILHLTESQLILQELRQEGFSFSDKWVNTFLLGSLLPDTKRKAEKVTSHFWNPDSLKQLAIAPDLQLFFQKYRPVLHGPLMLGYLAHLHLDACYVNDFWVSTMEFRDKNGKCRNLRSEIRTVWLKEKNIEIPVEAFFSGAYYYGDYSRMNAYLLDKYQLVLPKEDSLIDCPIEEADPADLNEVLEELRILKNTVRPGAEKDLQVFSLSSLEDFVHRTAELMADIIIREHFLNDQTTQNES